MTWDQYRTSQLPAELTYYEDHHGDLWDPQTRIWTEESVIEIARKAFGAGKEADKEQDVSIDKRDQT